VTLTISRASPDDAVAVASVRFASWQAAYGHLIPATFFDEFDHDAAIERWRAGVAAGTRHAFVAERESATVGYCSYGRCRDDDLPQAAEIYALYVHPDHWSTGAGRALLQAALDSLGDQLIVLWVLRDNKRARRFYELAGLLPDGSQRDTTMLATTPLPELRYRLLH
jgi:ribosomal protein S18 acetylase RimI-like enzyme